MLAALFIVKAGSSNTLSVFGTAHTPSAHAGVAGVIAGSVYTVLAFSGFEAAAPLAEEARDPRRTIRRAVLGATLGIGLIYVFTTYAADVLVGPGKFAGFGTAGPMSWEGIARASYGLYWVLVFLAIINSTIANANAGANVSTRTAYALGRIGIFPRSFTRLHPTHRSPLVAVGVQFVIAVGVTLALGFGYDPVTAFVLVATVIVIVVVAVYILVNAACIGFFLRFRRESFHAVRHLVVPVLGIVAFVPALLTAAGIPAFSFVTKLTARSPTPARSSASGCCWASCTWPTSGRGTGSGSSTPGWSTSTTRAAPSTRRRWSGERRPAGDADGRRVRVDLRRRRRPRRASVPARCSRCSPRTASPGACGPSTTWSARSASSRSSTRRPARSTSRAPNRVTRSRCTSCRSSRPATGARRPRCRCSAR